MRKLATLYSRTSTGATQTWEIEISGSKYRVVSGQLDGKKITSEWTQCESKNVGRSNETTPEEQAAAEAEAKWKQKCELGYHQNVSDIDKSTFVEPMLAKNFDDYISDIKYPVYNQPKLDGIRLVATKDSLKSRKGKDFASIPHIRKALEAFFDRFPDAVLDGELYCDKWSNDFNKICSIVRKTKPNKADIEESAAAIQYWVYDLADESKCFSQRYSWLQLNLETNECIRLVDTSVASNQAELDKSYEDYMSAGYEGQMIRLDEKYEFKRSRTLLKRKEFSDKEYAILDVEEGLGNKSGMAASMVFKNENGQVFNSNIKGDRSYLRELLANKDTVIGKQATVKYFNLTPDSIPRFPYVVAIRDYE